MSQRGTTLNSKFSTGHFGGLLTQEFCHSVELSKCRIGIADEHRSSLLGGFLPSSPSWPTSPPASSHQQHRATFPNSWSSSQQQGLSRQQSSLDLQADLLRQYFALQGLSRQSQILDHLLQQPSFRRVQRSRWGSLSKNLIWTKKLILT